MTNTLTSRRGANSCCNVWERRRVLVKSKHLLVQRANNQQKQGHKCLDSASVQTIELLLQYGANTDAVCDTRPPKERRHATRAPGCFISAEEILRRVYPDKSHLLTLLAEAHNMRARRRTRNSIPERQDTGITSPAWDPQCLALEPRGDVELRSGRVEPGKEIVDPRGNSLAAQNVCLGLGGDMSEIRGNRSEIRGGRLEIRGEGLEPRIKMPESGKRKRRQRLWAFLERILT